MKVLACISFATAVVGMKVNADSDPVFDYITWLDGWKTKYYGTEYLSVKDLNQFFGDAEKAGVRIPEPL